MSEAQKCSSTDETLDSSYVKTLKGLTGRTLKINSSWKNPTGMFRVGMKKAFELYPRGLQDRVKADRRKKKGEFFKEVFQILTDSLYLITFRFQRPIFKTSNFLRMKANY